MKPPSLLEIRVREYTELLIERLRLEGLEDSSCADELAEVNRRIAEMQQAAGFNTDSASQDEFVWYEDELEPGDSTDS
jgi:hypothetical protein